MASKSQNPETSHIKSQEYVPSDVQKTEITTKITVPTNGGWGWVVLMSSFVIIFIVDGQVFTFGTLVAPIARTFNIDFTMCVTVNSIQVALYFTMAPIASAIINKYGFRTVAMVGAILSYLGLITTYCSNHFSIMFIFMGFITGFGDAFIYMAATLVVGFYFEKYRAIASAISTGGSSIGVMVMYPVSNNLVRLSGWRTMILLHAGLHGFIYFLSFSFRPLLWLTVTNENTEKNTTIITYVPTKSERRSSTPSISRFPTAADILKNGSAVYKTENGDPVAGTSAAKRHSFDVQRKRQLDRVSIQSSASNMTLPQKKSCFASCFEWMETDMPEYIYRDDAFYTGKVEHLPIYRKSVGNINENDRTGLEYQLAVSRAVAVNQKGQGLCHHIAVRRILMTMMNPVLLRRKSFVFFCMSSFFYYAGSLVPYVFLQERNLEKGVNERHCSLFISVISFSNLIGRLINGFIVLKFDCLNVYIMCTCTAGVSTILSDLSYTSIYQFAYCVMFGFFSSGITCLRSSIIVTLYGLENLTNATGIVLLFMGIGYLISTPLAGIMKKYFNYSISFYVSGTLMTIGGVLALPVKHMANSEKEKEQTEDNAP